VSQTDPLIEVDRVISELRRGASVRVHLGDFSVLMLAAEAVSVESLRALGISYKVIEDLGIMLPVVELNVKYLRPARYDDLLTVTTQLREFPIDHRITFHQEIHNEEGKLLTIGTVKLYFMDKNLGNRASMPPFLAEKLSSYFS